jgi:hypothetical protein
MGNGERQNESGPRLPGPKRAFGRALADFQIEEASTPHRLHPAEERLLICAGRGELCDLGDGVPAIAADENRVRADFLRFLILGGDESAPVHEKGIRLRSAFIEGDVDLGGAKDVALIELWRCRIDGDFSAPNARLSELILRGTRLNAVNCDSAQIDGNVYLRDGFKAQGEVSFSGASIRGQLDCRHGTFENLARPAINFYSARIGGSVFLNAGFHAKGQVRFEASEVGGQFNCQAGRFENPEGFALNAIDAQIRGSVRLSHNFKAAGPVYFRGAEIGGDLFCAGGHFAVSSVAPSYENETPYAEAALNLQGAHIEGNLFLGPARAPANQEVSIKGSLNLQNAHAGVFIDAPASWPVAAIQTKTHGEVPCVIILDGFTYNRFGGIAITASDIRTKWLLRQLPDHLNHSFRPQPFEQLNRVLRDMGHDADGRRIALLKQSLMRPWRTRQARWYFRPFVSLTSWAWGLSCGYGYRPHRLIAALLTLWLACGFLYQAGAAHGGLAPKDAQIWTNQAYIEACDANWTGCQPSAGGKLGEIIAFDPFTYSADMLLPGIDLGQRAAWAPMRREIKLTLPLLGETALPKWTLRAAGWAENLLGVAGVILIGAILSGIVKRD